MVKVEITNGWYVHEENYIHQNLAEEILNTLFRELPWKSGEIQLFGKVYIIPRKQVYFSENQLGYSYSGKQLVIDVWHPTVLEIKEKVSKELNSEFNACLANLYRNGLDSNGWHADNEKVLGENPLIASLSFGATRRFDLRHKVTNEKLSVELKSGSLFVMGGEMQHYWKHQLPKQRKVKEPRINLTFRRIIS
ncbi:MAG: alpha-ketoglutarate-dependent dioxygenase AlkB [Crocinitomicaceae bacterium]|nr:alpha-ketoglutarate-dependent dioxygenase AlkB [Crocinitomicaceae bacterium]